MRPEPQLTLAVEAALNDEKNNDDDVLQLIFNHFVCDAVVRDMPDLAFRVAEHLLGLDRTLEEVVNDRSDYSTENISYAFGTRTGFSTGLSTERSITALICECFSALPERALDFIIRFVNRACEAFAHPNNRYEHIDPPGTITIEVDGERREQYANGRLFGAYRDMAV